jgi:hypothetical protein
VPEIRFDDEGIEIDAAVIAKGLGIEPRLVQAYMQEGKITSLCERGIDSDAGTFRLSFFTENKRLRVIVNEAGEVLRKSTFASPDRPLPASMRRPGL